jgi:hypothetical protein
MRSLAFDAFLDQGVARFTLLVLVLMHAWIHHETGSETHYGRLLAISAVLILLADSNYLHLQVAFKDLCGKHVLLLVTFSCRQLHLHVISQDLCGEYMKKKDHFLRFATPFFLSLEYVSICTIFLLERVSMTVSMELS